MVSLCVAEAQRASLSENRGVECAQRVRTGDSILSIDCEDDDRTGGAPEVSEPKVVHGASPAAREEPAASSACLAPAGESVLPWDARSCWERCWCSTSGCWQWHHEDTGEITFDDPTVPSDASDDQPNASSDHGPGAVSDDRLCAVYGDQPSAVFDDQSNAVPDDRPSDVSDSSADSDDPLSAVSDERPDDADVDPVAMDLQMEPSYPGRKLRPKRLSFRGSSDSSDDRPTAVSDDRPNSASAECPDDNDVTSVATDLDVEPSSPGRAVLTETPGAVSPGAFNALTGATAALVEATTALTWATEETPGAGAHVERSAGGQATGNRHIHARVEQLCFGQLDQALHAAETACKDPSPHSLKNLRQALKSSLTVLRHTPVLDTLEDAQTETPEHAKSETPDDEAEATPDTAQRAQALDLLSLCRDNPHWIVAGNRSPHGILVWKRKCEESGIFDRRLAIGSELLELERDLCRQRMFYRLLHGKGPTYGWVPLCFVVPLEAAAGVSQRGAGLEDNAVTTPRSVMGKSDAGNSHASPFTNVSRAPRISVEQARQGEWEQESEWEVEAEARSQDAELLQESTDDAERKDQYEKKKQAQELEHEVGTTVAAVQEPEVHEVSVGLSAPFWTSTSRDGSLLSCEQEAQAQDERLNQTPHRVTAQQAKSRDSPGLSWAFIRKGARAICEPDKGPRMPAPPQRAQEGEQGQNADQVVKPIARDEQMPTDHSGQESDDEDTDRATRQEQEARKGEMQRANNEESQRHLWENQARRMCTDPESIVAQTDPGTQHPSSLKRQEPELAGQLKEHAATEAKGAEMEGPILEVESPSSRTMEDGPSDGVCSMCSTTARKLGWQHCPECGRHLREPGKLEDQKEDMAEQKAEDQRHRDVLLENAQNQRVERMMSAMQQFMVSVERSELARQRTAALDTRISTLTERARLTSRRAARKVRTSRKVHAESPICRQHAEPPKGAAASPATRDAAAAALASPELAAAEEVAPPQLRPEQAAGAPRPAQQAPKPWELELVTEEASEGWEPQAQAPLQAKRSGLDPVRPTPPRVSPDPILFQGVAGDCQRASSSKCGSSWEADKKKRKRKRPLLVDSHVETARFMAAFRAHETEKGEKALFQDPFAKLLCGDFLTKTRMVPAMVPPLRTKYFDKFCRDAYRAGMRQFVFLGAGMDTRAFREDVNLRGATVFEVDKPQLFDLKEPILKGHTPGAFRVVVGLDLERDASLLRKSLLTSGYDPTRKSVWVAEGLFMYLTHQPMAFICAQISSLMTDGSLIGHDGVAAKVCAQIGFMGCPFVWGTDDWTKLWAPHGLEVTELVDAANIECVRGPEGLDIAWSEGGATCPEGGCGLARGNCNTTTWNGTNFFIRAQKTA